MMSYCFWENASELDRDYHDHEWGVPVHDDRKQFEFLMMESMQCGLSWGLMLQKREIFRKCFDNFDYNKIAQYNDDDVERIYNTEGMIKSKPKINAIIRNAKCFLRIIEEFGSFDQYIWSFTDHKSIVYADHQNNGMPVSNLLSTKISKDLKKRSFLYVGPVTIYSHLQGCGIINDHHPSCPCYKRIVQQFPTIFKEEDQGAKY